MGAPPRGSQLSEPVRGQALLPSGGGEDGGCCSSSGSPASPELSQCQEVSDQGCLRGGGDPGALAWPSAATTPAG